MVVLLKNLFLLLCGHAVADYALQDATMITKKNPRRVKPRGWIPDSHGPWWWTMLAHSLINGLAVYLACGSIICAIAETIIHFTSDTLKCAGHLSTNSDQIIHIICKLVWAAYATHYQGYL